MAYSNYQITPPVSIADLQKCFYVVLTRTVTINGVSQTQTILSGDLGVIIGKEVGDTVQASDNLGSWTVLRRSAINKWARYKPERAEGPKPIIHGEYARIRSRKANNFGLEVPYCPLDIMNGIVGDVIYEDTDFVAWEYLKPRGYVAPSEAEPVEKKEYFRLTDFTQIANDDTDPNYIPNNQNLKGYNHLAPVPLISWIDMTGVTFHDDWGGSEYGGVYDINTQVSDSIKIYFQNSVGYDLHIQDFINLSQNESTQGGKVWRPVIQVFDDSEISGEEWYERANEDDHALGTAITTQEGDLWSVELPLPETVYTPNQNYHYYHLCVGIGLVNDAYRWGSGNALFLLPCTDEQAAQKKWPFHYMFHVSKHNTNKLEVTQLGWFSSGSASWTYVTDTQTFEIGVNAAQLIRLKMTFTNVMEQNLDFIAYGETAQAGYTAMIVQFEEQISGSTVKTDYLQPTNSSWSNSHTTISGSASSVTLYATIQTSEIPAGAYATFYLKNGTGGGTENIIGSFSIHKRTTV